MELIGELERILGPGQVLTGADTARWARDWTGAYVSDPLAVVRPRQTAQVAAVLRLANAARLPVVPVGGNTGVSGGTQADGALVLSLDRMNRIREINTRARTAMVEAGVVLAALHEAAAAQDLAFPLTFGARGSAMVGGALSTNAGGSNVLRYGNARDLCLGLEAVLPSGEVMDLMGALHKDNSGYALKHLLIGAEGTLGVITAAVLRLVPRPRAHVTAMVAAADLDAALDLLNRLQDATGGAVEAFELMPHTYVEAHLRHDPGARAPFAQMHEVNLLVEIAATAARDAVPDAQGRVPLAGALEEVLERLLEEGAVLDAVIAQSEAQRAEMWARREAAAEVTLSRQPALLSDIAVPLDRVADFLRLAGQRVQALDQGAQTVLVSHLGDGNVHYAVWPRTQDREVHAAITEAVEEVTVGLGGSFSAEHGIGLSKLPSMARRKDRAALGAMRAIKQALDPQGILNPGKVLPG